MNVVVNALNTTVCFESPPENRILYSALARGAELPHECLSGTCGTCKARLTSGKVHMLWPDAPARSLIKQDEYLLCQCAAVTDCVFELAGTILGSARAERPTHRRGIIQNWRVLTPDVVSFSVILDSDIRFDAGQFAALQFPGVEGTRCYSMVNSASPTRHLDFVIKRKPGGGVSEWMFNVNRSAQEIDLFGPAGKATYDPDAPGDILCIAGGSGVAGMMSILRRAAENTHFHRHSGHLFFGLRKAADSFFLQELNELARAYPDSLHVTVAMSDEAVPQELRASYPALAFESGMVHEVAGVKLQSALKNVRAFVAGPPLAVSATLRMMMLQLKVSATSIKYDNFG